MAAIRALLLVAIVSAAAFAQQPRIDGISPTEGPIAGGTLVTLRGANFGGAAITLDRRGIAVVSQTDTVITLQMPPHDNGYAVIAIAQATGKAYGRFLYVAPRLADLPAGFITTITREPPRARLSAS